MASLNIACCYLPTKVIFVDDDKKYLERIMLGLNKNIICQVYTDQKAAIKQIKKDSLDVSFIQQWSQNLNRSEIDLGRKLEAQCYTHNYIDIDIPAIHQQIYNANRFNNIAVVVVDFAMPEMNGLELCKQLKNLPIKKLMLTGQADHKLGVDALNAGIIDKFIVKGSAEFNNKLNELIEDLQHQYFYDLSDAIIQNLVINPYCCLADKAFLNLFNKLCKEHNIIEYYLVKDNGCFLLLDIDGNVNWLACKTEKDMEHDYQSAFDNDAPTEIINELKQRKRIVFQLTEEDMITYTKANWQQYSHSAIKLEGERGIIYYAFIQGVAGYNIDAAKITSYNNFLQIS